MGARRERVSELDHVRERVRERVPELDRVWERLRERAPELKRVRERERKIFGVKEREGVGGDSVTT